MKTKILFILTTLLSINVIGQTTEFSFHLTSGLFSFRGSGSAKSSMFNVGSGTLLKGYTNNPWGINSGFSYGFAINAQRVTKYNLVFGLQSAYESLTSKIYITTIWNNDLDYIIAEGSKTDLNHQFFNLHPFIGKRFKLIKNLQTDLLIGFDIGFCLGVKEYPDIKTDLGIFNTSHERGKPQDDDYRLRIDIINYYKNFGLTIGYSHGLTNYKNGYEGGLPREVYSRMLRFGLVYKICI